MLIFSLIGFFSMIVSPCSIGIRHWVLLHLPHYCQCAMVQNNPPYFPRPSTRMVINLVFALQFHISLSHGDCYQPCFCGILFVLNFCRCDSNVFRQASCMFFHYDAIPWVWYVFVASVLPRRKTSSRHHMLHSKLQAAWTCSTMS